MEIQKERIYYLDVLKIVASFSVILIHVCAHSLEVVVPFGWGWQSINVLESFSRFAVPIFFMVSGALFLSKPRTDLKKLYLKKILRLLVAYVFWVLFYAIWNYCWGGGKIDLHGIGIILSDAILNPMYHLWFVPTMIGIYMLVPMFQKIIQNSSKKEIEYLLLLFFIFGIVRFSFIVLENAVLKYTANLFKRFSIDLFAGYVGYFLLGYYLNNYDFKKKIRFGLYALGIISLLICIFGTSLLSIKEDNRYISTYFYEYQFITTFFMSVAIFVLVKYLFKKIKLGNFAQKIIIEISNSSFGIYLIHLAVLSKVIQIVSIHSIPVCFLIVLTALCTFAIGLIIIMIIRKIPVINTYIV